MPVIPPGPYDHIKTSDPNFQAPWYIGFAFREWFGRTNGLRAQYDKAFRSFNAGESVEGILLALQLAARDVESTVILGDPAVAMPPLE